MQKIKEQYERSNPRNYNRNVAIFEQLLNKNHIYYEKGTKYGNIFVIDKPSEYICKKYQLATFYYNNNKKAHVIIFPYHQLKNIQELINDLKSDLYYSKSKNTKNNKF